MVFSHLDYNIDVHGMDRLNKAKGRILSWLYRLFFKRKEIHLIGLVN